MGIIQIDTGTARGMISLTSPGNIFYPVYAIDDKIFIDAQTQGGSDCRHNIVDIVFTEKRGLYIQFPGGGCNFNLHTLGIHEMRKMMHRGRFIA